jgi:uncharacterized protein (DUF433 family)
MLKQVKTSHPHVIRRDDLASGSPVVDGTKFPVRSIVQYVLRQGLTPEELAREFPQLTLAKIYDALSFYYEDREEIDRELRENTEDYWREKIG